LQNVNAHHTIIFDRIKLGAGLSERTFLTSIVAKRVANNPPTFVLVSAPIACHDKITQNDEARAVRAENWRAFQLTEVAPGVTKLNYTCSLNLRGSIPQSVTNKISVPKQQHGAPLIGLARSAPSLAGGNLRVVTQPSHSSWCCSAVDAAALLPASPAACPVWSGGRPSRRTHALGSCG
jgi:hypothetical protein